MRLQTSCFDLKDITSKSDRVTKEIFEISTPSGSERYINPDEASPKSSPLAIAVLIVCGIAGLVLRYLVREYAKICQRSAFRLHG